MENISALTGRRDVFLDERGTGLRVTWHPERDLVVLSVWQGDGCVGTFRMSVQDIPRLSGLLAAALGDWVDQSGGATGPGGAEPGGPGPGGTGPGAAAPASTQVTVLNALGTSGLAATAATKLRQSGYRITGVGNAPSADLARSQIAYAPGRLADAKTLASTLIGGASLVEDVSLTAPRLTLILGPGFTGVRALAQSGAGTGSGSGGAAGSGSAKKAKPKKAVPDLRPYDPRPC